VNRPLKSVPKLALVVDDMSVIRQLLMAILKHLDFECQGASNGRVALDLLARRKFDLVLCDWNMPGMNGSELVKAIRTKFPTLPIIMVTAECDPNRVAELRDLGVNGYVVKPFKPPVLVKLVEKLFPNQ
jgi:two-component system chemotaxis response regulator CheY